MSFIDEFVARLKPVTDSYNALQRGLVFAPSTPEDAMKQALSPLLKRLRDAVADAVQLLPAGGETSANFTEFFRSVGESVMEAQRQLDDSSLTYIKGRTGMHASPTVFRIPRVSASMKFSLESTATRKFNVVFYSDSQQATESHQQSVDFEILAVPPPPEYVPPELSTSKTAGAKPAVAPPPAMRAAGSVPRGLKEAFSVPEMTAEVATEAVMPVSSPEPQPPVLHEPLVAPPLVEPIIDPKVRAHVFAHFDSSRHPGKAANRALRKNLLARDRERVLIFPAESPTEFFLVRARPGRTPELAVWHLVIAPRHELRLIHHQPSSVERNQALSPLYRHLGAIADRQADYLRSER